MEEFNFVKASEDSNLINLRDSLIEMSTKLILEHEQTINSIYLNHFPEKRINAMCTENLEINQMIISLTQHYFNNLWTRIKRSDQDNDCVMIRNLAKEHSSSEYSVIASAFRIKSDCHLDISRVHLSVDTIDELHQTLLNQINLYLHSETNRIVGMIDLTEPNPDSDDPPFCIKQMTTT